jgi:SAM-dependent methyltransferase
MLATRAHAIKYRSWNDRYGAPFGNPAYRTVIALPLGSGILRRIISASPRLRGAFSFQSNNTTREVEYPWAFCATPIEPGMRVLEIGGGLSGFQFVLSRAGCSVVNVDPGMGANGRGWPVDNASIARLNRSFGTNVQLFHGFLRDAPIAPGSLDRVFSISTIEHIPTDEARDLMVRVYELLKPGGCCVLTVDLFLNLQPFTTRERNEFGSNISVKMLAEAAPFQLIEGNRHELYGYPEFDPDAVLRNLDTLMMGSGYPAIPQLCVLRKAA